MKYIPVIEEMIQGLRDWRTRKHKDDEIDVNLGIDLIKVEALASIARSLDDILFQLEKMNGG